MFESSKSPETPAPTPLKDRRTRLVGKVAIKLLDKLEPVIVNAFEAMSESRDASGTAAALRVKDSLGRISNAVNTYYGGALTDFARAKARDWAERSRTTNAEKLDSAQEQDPEPIPEPMHEQMPGHEGEPA